MSTIWHDLECGTYSQDLALWRALAAAERGPVLDLGAGTGRVALELARDGHEVTALDLDAELLAELRHRAGDLPVETVCADARAFSLEHRYGLCLAPMQTVQLLGGEAGRRCFFDCVRDHMRRGALLAMAIVEAVECYEIDESVPGLLPDMVERDGVVYSSLPTAVRADAAGFLLARRRERIDTRGGRSVEEDVVRLDALSCAELESEAQAAGLALAGRREIPATSDHVGSAVVMVRA